MNSLANPIIPTGENIVLKKSQILCSNKRSLGLNNMKF